MRAVGIRYATAERFQPPRAVGDGRPGTDVGPAAPQAPSRLEPVLGPMRPTAMSEDCLSLNVWAPDGADRLPVLVWLHGGAFLTGSGGLPHYDGAALADAADVVVVTVNYRLGALGFLHPPGRANLGVLDQILALRWVHDNIAAYGGDPGNVTLGGQSAGAACTLALMHHADAASLFHRALVQSAPIGLPPVPLADAERRAGLVLAELGAADPATAPVTDLMRAAGAVARRLSEPMSFAPPFQLAADGVTVPADLLAPPATGIPVLIGRTEHEGMAFFRPATPETDRIGHDIFERDLVPYTKALRDNGNTVDTYLFRWYPRGSEFRACHCIDLPFTTGNLDAWRTAPMLAGAEETDLLRLRDEAWAGLRAFLHGERWPGVWPD
jgi:para-nitrobenzyl esterase